MEPQISAHWSIASLDEPACRPPSTADDAFALQVRHADIECALGAAMAAGE